MNFKHLRFATSRRLQLSLPTRILTRKKEPLSQRLMSTLAEYLLDAKKRYLSDVRTGEGRSWIVVMGNEAGDLDSIASSLAYAWFLSSVKQENAVPLIQTPRGDLPLRPENTHVFALAGLTADQGELLCIDDEGLGERSPFPSDRFALVDHNRLVSRFEKDNAAARVVAVLDHHEDEGLYRNSAEPREIIVPTGSAASVVTRYVRSQITEEGKVKLPSEIATLLFCAILLDTNGLKPDGKAEALDYEAGTYLYAHSSLASSADIDSLSGFASPDIGSLKPVQTLTSDLLSKKSDVTHLSSLDLLRRDYKQYNWTTSTPSERRNSVAVGLSTVPVGLKAWLSRTDWSNEFWDAVDAFMSDMQLDVLGILTTFRGAGTGKHKRQIVLILRTGKLDAGLEDRLWAGLEGAAELDLKERSFGKYTPGKGGDKHGANGAGARNLKMRVYKQRNAKATRKAVAPLLKTIFEGSNDRAE